jgi:hypothetical protein
MAEPRLVLPADVEQAVIDVVNRRHAEHLAKLERQRGLTPGRWKPFVTVVRMADADAVRLSGDTVPALLLGTIGLPVLSQNEDETIDGRYQMGMQVTVMGQRRRDTLLRRDAYAWTTAECIYQRLPRSSNLVQQVALVDYEPLASGDDQRTVGDARLIWELDVPNIMAIVGTLPADDRPIPPDTPGGPPSDPRVPPLEFPEAGSVVVRLDRSPIVE